MSSFLRRIADHALSVGAFLGVAALLSASLGAALGVRPLFFRSGSMSPAIGTGALALARSVPASDLRVGDVVSVTTASGSRVTHRVVRTETMSGQVLLTLRGDANRVPDAQRYPVESAYRVFWHVPWLGYAVGAMVSPGGLFVLGLLVMGLLVLATRRRPDPPSGGRRARRGARRAAPRRARRATAAAVASVAVIAGPASAAPWTDDVLVSGQVLAAASLLAPDISCAGGGLLTSPTISWSTPSGPTPSSYLVTYVSGSDVQTATTTGNSWQLPSGVLSLLATYTITVKSVLANWQSPASNTEQINVTSVLFVGVVSSCA